MSKFTFDSTQQGEGGGLYQGPIKVSNARWGKTNFNGKVGDGAIALLMTGIHADADGDLIDEEYIFSVGKGWLPSEDNETPSDSNEGNFLIPSKDDIKLNKNTACAIFLRSLQEKRGGTPLDDNAGAEQLNDMMLEIKREVFATSQNKDRQCYVVAEVLTEVPWERKAPLRKVLAKAR